MSKKRRPVVNIRNVINISTDQLTASEQEEGERDGTDRLGVSCHIGVDEVDPKHYDGWSGPLQSCELDARDMASIAEARGYNSRRLLTSEATRSAVTSNIKSAAERLRPGDIFFLSYAGHGGSVEDLSADEKDGMDETWCLYDGQLIDDELAVLWTSFRAGVRILCISDSCHSGSVTRSVRNRVGSPDMGAALSGVNTNFRVMPGDIATRTFNKNRDFYLDVLQAIPAKRKGVSPQASVRLLSGCQDNQLAADGASNGLFTSKLKEVYDNGAFKWNYEVFHREIATRMPPDQTPNHLVTGPRDQLFDAQRPFEIG